MLFFSVFLAKISISFALVSMLMFSIVKVHVYRKNFVSLHQFTFSLWAREKLVISSVVLMNVPYVFLFEVMTVH